MTSIIATSIYGSSFIPKKAQSTSNISANSAKFSAYFSVIRSDLISLFSQ